MRLLSRNERPRSRRCRQLEVLLSAYADGELEGAERTRERCRVEAHLEACGACRDRLEAWTGDLALLDLGSVEAPRDPWFAQRFARRLTADTAGPVHDAAAHGLGWRLLPVVVVLVGLTLGTWIRVVVDEPGVDPGLVSRLLEMEPGALPSAPMMAGGRAVGAPMAFEDLLRPTGQESSTGAEPSPRFDAELESVDSRTIRFDKDR